MHDDTASTTSGPDPWAVVRRMQDPRRYLKILSGRRPGREGSRRVDPAVGIARTAHPLLGSPASMTRTATSFPADADVAAYARHSADLVVSGGPAAALAYPLAVAELAEHYVFRRVAGSSAGAAVAAATAAAELGRGAAQTPSEDPTSVPAGFAGLARAIGWLAGSGGAGAGSSGAGAGGAGSSGTGSSGAGGGSPDESHGDQWRLARMFAPGGDTRSLFRLVAALMMVPHRRRRARWLGVGAAVLGALGRFSKVVMLLLWTGFLLGGAGMVFSQVAAARYAPGGSVLLAVLASAVLVVALAMSALLGSLLVYGFAIMTFLQEHAERNHFGLVPGVRPHGPRERLSLRLDRLAGVPDPAGVPPLAEWLADRIDDLAGVTGRCLTFGDLWLGRSGERTAEDAEALRAAADDPERRVIDLRLLTTDLTLRRPMELPLPSPEVADRLGVPRFLFCETCCERVLPRRVVDHMLKAAPSTDTEHTCPRHSSGVLRELPDPWDLPVIVPVRMSLATPGMLRAVPLYSVGSDEHEPVITHWLADGKVTGGVDVDAFDALLPRWPTFALSVESPEESRSIDSAAGFWSAVLGSRVVRLARLPGFAERVAAVTRPGGGSTIFVPDGEVLALGLRGREAGAALRERFTGPDGEITGQTWTDRHRWIRMRMAVAELRRISLELGARLPLYTELTAGYRVPAELVPWFSPPLEPGTRDRSWADAAAALTTLRAMSAGGVLDYDASDGAPPLLPRARLVP